MLGAWIIAAWLGSMTQETTNPTMPPLWSGKFGFEAAEPPTVPKAGEVRVGDILGRTSRRPTRLARLTQAYRFGEGEQAVLIPAGTPFFASLYPIIEPVGSKPLPPRRNNDLTWCVAATAPPYACFRWNGPGDVEYAPATDGPAQNRRPFVTGWVAAPEPRLREEAIAVSPEEELMVVKSIGPVGVTVTTTSKQGALETSYDRPVWWGQGVWYPGRDAELTFSPIKDSRGRIIGATANLGPP